MTVSSTLAALSSGNSLGASIAWNLIVAAVAVVATIRTVKVPAERWAYGAWSKAAAVVAAWWLTIHLAAMVVPVGAVIVIWHTRTLSRPKKDAAVPAVPFAEGTPEATPESNQ